MSTPTLPRRATTRYLSRSHYYIRLEPQEVEQELPVRPFAMVVLDAEGHPHYLDHTKRYRAEDLQRAATEGRLYLVHAARWGRVEEVPALNGVG